MQNGETLLGREAQKSCKWELWLESPLILVTVWCKECSSALAEDRNTNILEIFLKFWWDGQHCPQGKSCSVYCVFQILSVQRCSYHLCSLININSLEKTVCYQFICWVFVFVFIPRRGVLHIKDTFFLHFQWGLIELHCSTCSMYLA